MTEYHIEGKDLLHVMLTARLLNDGRDLLFARAPHCESDRCREAKSRGMA